MFGFLRKKFSEDNRSQHNDDSPQSIVEGLIVAQLSLEYHQPKEAFSSIMTNKIALGYILGLHDACFQSVEKIDRENPNAGFLRNPQLHHQRLHGLLAAGEGAKGCG